MFEHLLPRHLQIIYEINHRHLEVSLRHSTLKQWMNRIRLQMVSWQMVSVFFFFVGHPFVWLAENQSAVPRGRRSLEEDVPDRGRRPQEDQHGSPVCGGLPRSQRSRSDPLRHCQEHCVSTGQFEYWDMTPNRTSLSVCSSWLVIVKLSSIIWLCEASRTSMT